MKNSLKVTLAYLAAVIGAGFASGSETVHYFVRFGNVSVFGVLLTSVGFGYFSYMLLKLCKKHNVSSFNELSQIVFGKKLAKSVNVLMIIFMFILLAAMISAFSEMMYLLFNAPKTLSSIAFSVLCYYVLTLPSEKIVKWGGISGFVIVLLICFCSLYMLTNRTVKVFNNLSEVSASAGVYTAYNFFAICPLLCEWSNVIKKKECKIVGCLSAMLSFFALFLIWALISIFYDKIPLGEMPMITLSARQSSFFMYVYGVVVFMAVLSSAVANAYGIFLKWDKVDTGKHKKLLLIVLGGWVLSSLGFTRIVTNLYMYVGCAVLIIITYVVVKSKINGVCDRKTE